MAWSFRRRTIEYVIYLLFWVVLLMSPFFGAFLKDSSFLPTTKEILSFWEFLLPALVLFFVNNNILMPFLLYKKKGRLFVLYLLCIVIACSIIFISLPAEKPHGVRAPRGHTERFVQPPVEMVPVAGSALPAVDKNLGKVPPSPVHHDVWMFFTDPKSVRILIVLFVLIFNMCVRLFFFTIRRDEHVKELEKERLRSNLEYLRYQINPHFFMNTLNNIHALIDIDKEKAQKAVHEFSKMMRYVLYDTSTTSVPLEKEIAFLNGYIDLMRLRYTDKLEVRTSFDNGAHDVYVPPMLFMQFVENAFKHGVTYKKETIIDVALRIDDADNMLLFTCRNTMPKAPAAPLLAEKGGIGIENARKRLELLFGERATLRISSDEKWYNVELKIPIKYGDKVYNC